MAAAEAPSVILQVAVDRPLRKALDYLPPRAAAGVPLAGETARPTLAGALPGVRVRVPVGRSRATGVIVGSSKQSEFPAERLKHIEAILDAEPTFTPSLLELLQWTADYYHHPLGELLIGVLPKALREGAPLWPCIERLVLTAAGEAALAEGEPRRAPRQRELIELLAAGSRRADELPASFSDWRPAARALQRRGWLRIDEEQQRPVAAATVAQSSAATGTDAQFAAKPLQAPLSLTTEQQAALDAVLDARGRFAPLLLAGATGSGKTEVYLQAVAATLAEGRNALVLVPEIGLTPQLVGRFQSRFAVDIEVLHSALGDGERLAAWRRIRAGQARIVIGTRSAVFAPLDALGLIVVDEEHDSSYKQHEGGCRYSARDVAVRRAQLASCPVLMGSATPSFESLHNAREGRYRQLQIPRRGDQAASPTLALIDLREHSMRDGLSGPVAQAIERHLASDGQALVYINRRGYAPTLLCTACGWIAPCAACDARLTVHRAAQRLRCHICGAEQPLPATCTRCGHPVKPVGQGTERVEAALAAMFPDAPLLRLDRDTARSAEDVESVMQALLERRARILVGTQMVTKGHHFPGVTLVAVLNADQGLFSTDFRAAERLAQTIVQVAGRAGRAERAGEVLIQTEYPDHPLLRELLDAGYAGFAEGALAERAAARWPPYTRLALLRVSATTARAAHVFLTEARRLAGKPLGIQLLGPVDAHMARRADRHHAQLLVESASRPALQKFLAQWLAILDGLESAKRVRWAIDVDPLDTQ